MPAVDETNLWDTAPEWLMCKTSAPFRHVVSLVLTSDVEWDVDWCGQAVELFLDDNGPSPVTAQLVMMDKAEGAAAELADWLAEARGETLPKRPKLAAEPSEWVPLELWKAERKLADREPVGVKLCNPGLVFDWFADEIVRLPVAERLSALRGAKTFLGATLADDQVLCELADGRRELVIEGAYLWAVVAKTQALDGVLTDVPA